MSFSIAQLGRSLARSKRKLRWSFTSCESIPQKSPRSYSRPRQAKELYRRFFKSRGGGTATTNRACAMDHECVHATMLALGNQAGHAGKRDLPVPQWWSDPFAPDSSHFSQSIAAAQPEPAAVIACR